MIALVPRRAGSRRALVLLTAAAAMCATLGAPARPALAARAQPVSAKSSHGHAGVGIKRVSDIRPQDEIVFVDVRRLGGCCDPDLLATKVRYEVFAATDGSPRRRWQSSGLQNIVGADPSVNTVVFVHGNRITPGDAKQEALIVYRRIVRQADSDAPIRFVIFSWPSAQIRGPLKDVRLKAARTRPAGCQLAWFVDQLPAETPVTLVGFSFGARIVTGALHVLGGGRLGGLGLAESHNSLRAPMNAVLIASALNADWLAPGHYHGRAMSRVNHMMLVNNNEDRAMRFYHLSSQGGRPQALGLCGPTCIDSAAAARISERNVANCVGKQHDLMCYTSIASVSSQIWFYTMRL